MDSGAINKEELMQIINKYMQKHKLDQKAMAERLDISEGTLSAWLNPNRHGITRKNAARIKFFCADVLPEVRQLHNSTAVQNSGDHNIFFNAEKAESIIADCRNKLISALIEADIDPVALKQVLQIINSIMGAKK